MKLKTLLAAVIILGTTDAWSQTFGQKLTGGINFALGFPAGEFKEVNDKVAIGGRGYIMYNPSRQAPVYLGLELGYHVMGSQTEYFYATVYGFYDQYKITASSNIFALQFKLRLQQPKLVAVRPFVEGIVGWNDFFSTVNVERESFNGNYNTNGGNSSDAYWAFTYGGAAGLNIVLDRKQKLFLELKTAYMIGRSAKYLTDPQITNTGQVYFTEKQSETNMVLPQVGIKFGI